jgi:hypothetical protein
MRNFSTNIVRLMLINFGRGHDLCPIRKGNKECMMVLGVCLFILDEFLYHGHR